MTSPFKTWLAITAFCFFSLAGIAQGYNPDCCTYYVPDGNESSCIGGPCCLIAEACNGPYSPYNNYDYDYHANTENPGCAMPLPSCPIDSGAFILLCSGAFFGVAMISRRRREALLLDS
jgi:hypothetical protein